MLCNALSLQALLESGLPCWLRVKQVLIQILPATSGIKLHLQPSHLPSYLCGRGGYA
jgi:hypothetical protein